MSDYIEREAALGIVNGWREQLIPTYGKNDEYVKCLETVAEHLESLHAADVRPVVLCADCEYNTREVTDLFGNNAIQCITGLTHRRDWFCADGKKREES